MDKILPQKKTGAKAAGMMASHFFDIVLPLALKTESLH